MAAQGTVQELVEFVRDYRITTSVLVAATSWMVYDMLLTLKDDVEYLRSSKWNVTKILFIILRLNCMATLILYIYVSNLPSSEPAAFSCKHMIQATLICVAMHWYIGQFLLLWRICALYYGNRRVIGLVIGLYMCEVGLLTAVVVGELQTLLVLPVPPGIPISACIATNLVAQGHISLAFCLFDILLSTVFFVLTAVKFLRSVDSAPTVNGSRGLRRFRGTKNLIPVLFLFFRDGSMYYFAVQASQIFFFVFTNAPSLVDSGLASIGAPVSLVTITLATSRLVYSLRRGLTPDISTTTFEMGAMPRPGIVFNHELSDMSDPDHELNSE